MQNKKDKHLLEADEICNQANALAGLTQVISMYFESMNEDEYLADTFLHLADIAFKHKNDCHEFFDKYCIS